MNISAFGQRMGQATGIGRLMEDLASGIAGPDVLMLGGGNPAHIPKVEDCFREHWLQLADDKQLFGTIVGDYDAPQGKAAFIESLCQLLNVEFDWNITPQNIALTNGSQSAFLALFNLFAGTFPNGQKRKILFPLTPEYIGYCDMGLEADLLTAQKPRISHLDDHLFKYYVDFEQLQISHDIGAICVSRPTNPTGNVLTDEEILKLETLAVAQDIPFLIDNAYGAPFPNILYTKVNPIWNENLILCLSLSKLGLPAARTGIVIANTEIVQYISNLNAVMSLAPGGLGAALVNSMILDGQLLRISREIIRPFYEEKVRTAHEVLGDLFSGLDYTVHKPEGAFFLWVWLKSMKITTREFYQRLKQRGVIIVPGEYFYPGLDEAWEHKHQCIRISVAQSEITVEKGLKIISEEVKKVSK